MTRVVHVIWTAHFGGIEKLVHDLAVVQASDPDLKVSLLLGIAKGEFLEKFKKAGLECIAANLNGGADMAPWKLVRVRRLLRDFDVLHTHTFVPPLALAEVASGKHIVFTEHGGFGFGRELGLSDRIKRPLYQWFMGRHVSCLTFNSDWTRRVWEERNASINPRRCVVNNGIPSEALNGNYSPSPTGLESQLGDAFVIGTTSRFAGFKRIDRLIVAFAEFSRDRNTRLVIVGDGVLRAELEALAGQLGIANKTIFTGFRPDARACQALMHVCVFPSENEPFGLVAVESLSLGKPTLVFADGGGIVDIVRPTCASDIVEDEDELVRRLTHYYDHPDEITDGHKERREHARRYDIRSTAAEFKAIYQSILSC